MLVISFMTHHCTGFNTSNNSIKRYAKQTEERNEHCNKVRVIKYSICYIYIQHINSIANIAITRNKVEVIYLTK